MTTEELVSFICANIQMADFTPCYGSEKYLKGYIQGLITMASVQQIISLETVNELRLQLEAAAKEAEENHSKNTDQTPTV